MTSQEEDEAICKKAREHARAFHFLQTTVANLDNAGLTDAEFRDFMRRSLNGMPGLNYPPEK